MIVMTIDHSSKQERQRAIQDDAVGEVIQEFDSLTARRDVGIRLRQTQTGDELLIAIDAERFFVAWDDGRGGVYELNRNDDQGGSVAMRIGGQQTHIDSVTAVTKDEVRRSIREFASRDRSGLGLHRMRR